MYSVGETLPVETLQSGSLLLSAPAMTGKYELLLSIVAEGISADEGGLFVTTNDDAADVIADVEERLGHLPETLRIVDCVSERKGDASYPPAQVEYVSSPGDMTGIGIGISEQLRRTADSDVEGTRLAFYSLSTLLMYAELETVFRFLHVLTGRIGGVDGLGIFAIDPTTHEESTLNTLKQLFDGVIELRVGAGGREIRLVGVDDAPAEWAPVA